MSWKDISKSSYTLRVRKFAEWAPSHPFTIPYQGPKVRYSEGDEISSVADPVFNIEFTGSPLSGQHFPCGYWHKNYIPPQGIIYTSCIYPLEFTDSFKGIDIQALDGVFKSINIHIDYGDSFQSLNFDLVSGILNSIVRRYSYTESFEGLSLDMLSGIFRDVVIRHTLPPEFFNHTNFDLVSGIFNDVTIRYNYWPAEGFECTSLNILSGEFYAH